MSKLHLRRHYLFCTPCLISTPYIISTPNIISTPYIISTPSYTDCENFIDSFDPLKKTSRSGSVSSDDVILTSRNTSPQQQQHIDDGHQQVKVSKSSDALHPTTQPHPHQLQSSYSPLLLRHSRSDPMLLDNSDVQSRQWSNNNISARHRSSSYDNVLQPPEDSMVQDDHKPTTPDSDPHHPSFYIDHSDDDLDDRAFTRSLPAVGSDKHRTHSQPPSIRSRLSPKLSPKSSPKHSPEMKRKQANNHCAYRGLPKSSKLVDKSRVQANNPSLSKRKPRSATVIETSAADYEKSKAQLGRYFRPGVLMLKDVNPRMCIIQKKLKEKESDFCHSEDMK